MGRAAVVIEVYLVLSVVLNKRYLTTGRALEPESTSHNNANKAANFNGNFKLETVVKHGVN